MAVNYKVIGVEINDIVTMIITANQAGLIIRNGVADKVLSSNQLVHKLTFYNDAAVHSNYNLVNKVLFEQYHSEFDPYDILFLKCIASTLFSYMHDDVCVTYDLNNNLLFYVRVNVDKIVQKEMSVSADREFTPFGVIHL